jgi:hypothetical protein
MISVCPRCGTPRSGDLGFCPECGFDYSPAPAASTCPRCNAPLYPGYTLCGNCGFDSRFAGPAPWQGQPPPGYGQIPAQAPPYGQWPGYPQASAVRPRRNNLGIALIVLGVALLAVAGMLTFLAVSHSGSSALPSPTSSPLAAASQANLAIDTAAPVDTAAAAATSLAAQTAEPAPGDAWTRYTSTDGAWSVLFPGASPSPIQMTQAIGSGTYKGNARMFIVAGPGGAAYAVMFVDFDAAVFKSVDTGTVLSIMGPSLALGVGGTVVSASDTTEGTYPARDLTISTAANLYNMRIWVVGARFYVLMSYSTPGADVFPQHFIDSFELK